MVIRSRLAVAPALAVLCACGTVGPPPVIDAALSARVPPATVALAGINLDQLRASPLYTKSSAAMRQFLTPLADAHEVLIASTGTQLLAIARGAVPGAMVTTPGIALYGDPKLIAAGAAQHPPAGILRLADSVAAGHTIWIALRGGIALPLEGNLANANKLLHDTEFVTLTAQPADPADFQLTAQCPSSDAALRFEQSLRAIVSLAIATGTRQPATIAALQSIRIQRDERVVHVSLSAPLDTLLQLLSPG
jgi:hypothetical protein